MLVELIAQLLEVDMYGIITIIIIKFIYGIYFS